MKKEKTLTEVIKDAEKKSNVKASQLSKSYLSKAAATCQSS